MSQIAEGISQIAAVGATIFKFIPGGKPIAAALTVVSAAASVIAQLTATPPVSVPAIGEQQIGTNLPSPYLMGRARSRGSLVYIEAHGNPLDGVPNPFLSRAWVHSVAGPVESMGTFRVNEQVINFEAVGEPPGAQRKSIGYYDRFMWLDDQVGEQPTTSAMEITDNFGQEQRWTSAHKLNGMAASLVSIRADDKETHYASGIPDTDRVMQGVKCYDPRLDSTYPGGSGAARSNDETTFTYSQNPAVHAITYVLGRIANGKPIFGPNINVTSIRMEDFVALANVCDANGWTIAGTIYESGKEGEAWNNLKLILQAAGAKPVIIGGKLGCIYEAPRVSVATITKDDLMGGYSVPKFRQWRNGRNTVIPRYMSEANNWQYVSSDAIEIADLVTLHGETRPVTYQFDLVSNKDQAAALGVYRLYDDIEISPISLVVGPRFMGYDVGDALTLDLDELGLSSVTAVIIQHTIDFVTGLVTLGLKVDTAAKHTLALGQTGSAPFHPVSASGETLDNAATIYRVSSRVNALEVNVDTALTGGGGALSANASVDFVSAYGSTGQTVQTGTIIVQITGGVPPYSVVWTKVSGDAITAVSPNSSITKFEGVVPVGGFLTADFEWEVTDSAGVPATVTDTVTARITLSPEEGIS